VDTAAIAVIGDAYGARINVSFTRMDMKLISQNVIKEGNQVTSIPNNSPKAEPVKIVEFTAEMRPDQAFALLAALQNALGNLPEPVRRQFGMNDALLNLPSNKGS
jgi:hypothetical protein